MRKQVEAHEVFSRLQDTTKTEPYFENPEEVKAAKQEDNYTPFKMSEATTTKVEQPLRIITKTTELKTPEITPQNDYPQLIKKKIEKQENPKSEAKIDTPKPIVATKNTPAEPKVVKAEKSAINTQLVPVDVESAFLVNDELENVLTDHLPENFTETETETTEEISYQLSLEHEIQTDYSDESEIPDITSESQEKSETIPIPEIKIEKSEVEVYKYLVEEVVEIEESEPQYVENLLKTAQEIVTKIVSYEASETLMENTDLEEVAVLLAEKLEIETSKINIVVLKKIIIEKVRNQLAESTAAENIGTHEYKIQKGVAIVKNLVDDFSKTTGQSLGRIALIYHIHNAHVYSA